MVIGSLGLLFICDPVLIINYVFVEIFLAFLQVKSHEPLISKGVELHRMTLFPRVHRTTNLHLVVFWAVIVEHESVWLSV